jgi:subtilisin family serine protease
VVASHRVGVPAVANMSLVGPRSQILNDAVAAVIADGLAVTVAAGNSPVDACTQSPASAPGAITTGAMTQQDSVASFSAVGPCLDIYAPGYSVLTTATTPSRRGANQVVLASGTSMASAFAAGAVGLGLSLDPALTPRQVAQGITDSATGGALSGVPPATPNLLLYVGNGALPLPVAARPATPRVLSGLTARFTFRRPMGTPAGRFRLTGATGLPGMLTVTRAGRLLSRRHVQAGPFAFRTRVARPMTVLRVQLRPDDIERTPASALVRVTVRRP